MTANRVAFITLLIVGVIVGYLTLEFFGKPGEWALSGLLSFFYGRDNKRKAGEAGTRAKAKAADADEEMRKAAAELVEAERIAEEREKVSHDHIQDMDDDTFLDDLDNDRSI